MRAARFGPPAAVLAALVVIHTWPLLSSPAHLSINYNEDAQVNEWILSWIARTLPSDPLHLFDGNIFSPERGVLTYADPLVVPALLGAPVRWLGGSPVLTFNLVLSAGLAITGFAGWWAVWRWTGSPAAALTAGALVAFNQHTLTRLPHTAGSHLWGLPLVLYLADRLVERPSRRDALFVALTVAATSATSAYTLALAGVIVACVLASALAVRAWRGAAALAASSLAGLVIAAPVLLPYARFAAGGATRPLELVAEFTATPSGYVTSMSRMHGWWSAPYFRDDLNVFFAGLLAIGLAALGLFVMVRERRSRRRALTLVALAVSGIVLSFGPDTALYVWLYEHVPPLQGIRVPLRFGYLYLLVVGLLAGCGLAWLLQRVRARARLLGAAALVVVTLEATHAPIRTTAFEGVPPIYSLLADVDSRVELVEVPFWPPEAIHLNGEYVLNSTAHWRPLMNGASGFIPLSYRERANVFWYFPGPGTVDAMRKAGATHVMVHLERLDDREQREWTDNLDHRRDLWLVATDTRGHRLYEVK